MPGLAPHGDEPDLGPWRVQAGLDLLHDLLAIVHARTATIGRPVVVAVDGRSGSGKTTVAGLLAAGSPGSVVVHTDDVAWWESCFGWDQLLRTGILEPVRRGEPVAHRPPAWDARGRKGAIEVPAGTRLVVVEGVGSSRRSLTPHLDAVLWVQSDYDEANRRGIARDASEGQGPDFWWGWMAEENPFLRDDRPWERADAVVCGTPSCLGVILDPAREVLRGVASPPPPRRP